ncbi:MAG: S9 family peptidase, partial [Deltaproteobacteria bacterium]
DDMHVMDVRFFPDGKTLLVRAAERATIDHEMMYSGLFTVSVDGGRLARLVETEGKIGDMAVSPDGRYVAFTGAHDIHDSTSGIVYVVGADGRGKRALSADAPLTFTRIAFRDARRLVGLAVDSTRTRFYEFEVKKGTMRALSLASPVCGDFDLEAQTVACAGSTPEHPAEVFAARLGERALRRLSVSNEHLLDKKLGAQQVFRWKAADGLELEGILILPVGYEKGTRYPLAVLPHGGPEGVSLDGWRTRATYPAQILATAGYAVFEPNYRGSSGRGWRFATADHWDLGGKEFTDVLDGIDALAAEGIVDPDRVGMAGWSYGGYFSALAATMHSERFKAAMIGAAVTDWVSFTGTTEIEHENSLVHWNLWPWDDLDLAWSRSPIRHVDKAKTPALVVHGLADTRVPPGQGLEIYRALRHKKVPTQLVLYPREPHGLVENVHSLDFIERLVGWFDRYVKGTAAAE